MLSKTAESSDASDLTLGKVICGNPSKALMSRRKIFPDKPTDNESKFDPTVSLSSVRVWLWGNQLTNPFNTTDLVLSL